VAGVTSFRHGFVIYFNNPERGLFVQHAFSNSLDLTSPAPEVAEYIAIKGERAKR
jgi:hypothetical protein